MCLPSLSAEKRNRLRLSMARKRLSRSDSSRSAPAVKLRISPSAAYNDRKGILPKNVDNFFEKMGVKKRLAMQTAQKNIYLTYEKST